MKTNTKLQKKGYSGVKVTSQIQALKHSDIHIHLRLVQQNELSTIDNKYKKLNYISQSEMEYLFGLYWNFVLNDFRFEDKTRNWSIVTKHKKIEYKHIGMKIFNNLQ